MSNQSDDFPTITLQNRNGEEFTFTSSFQTLAEAYHALAAANAKRPSEFAESLLLAARERRATGKQIAWIHKLATDAVRVPARVVVEGLDLTKLVTMLTTAGVGARKLPSVTLNDVTIRLCGRLSSRPGTLAIMVGDVFVGRVAIDGTVEPSRAWTPEVEQLLRDFAERPLEVAAAEGRASGRCCFCRRELTAKRSIELGYGPICAEIFGLA